MIEQVKKKLETSNTKYIAVATTHRRHETFQVGDMVFVRKKHGRSQKKLDQKKYVPFKIL